MDPTRTIVALSSGVAAAQRAIIRISGPNTANLLQHVVLDDIVSSTRGSQAWRTRLQFAFPAIQTLQHVPATVYFWPNHRSFTGEPSAELHLLGSLPIVEAVLETLVQHGADHASRGEFTLRSFLAGRIDLAQAEAILGVIEATAEAELSFALGQLAGNISRPVASLRNQLIELTAHLEAGLDFVEEDIEFISKTELHESLSTIVESIESLLSKLSSRGSRQRLPSVVLTGLPNAGKSTLFNRLLDSQRAIVSSVAGTTRDALEALVQLPTLRFNLVDTAGLEETDLDTPRGIAQQVVEKRLGEADLILHCVDQTLGAEAVVMEIRRQRLATQTPDGSKRTDGQAPILVVGTKADLAESTAVDCRVGQNLTGDLEQLLLKVEQKLGESLANSQGDALHRTTLRCREGLEQANLAIQSAMEASEADWGEELTATELRIAIQSLSGIIGSVHNEDILGEIFGRFCIGK